MYLMNFTLQDILHYLKSNYTLLLIFNVTRPVVLSKGVDLISYTLLLIFNVTRPVVKQ